MKKLLTVLALVAATPLSSQAVEHPEESFTKARMPSASVTAIPISRSNTEFTGGHLEALPLHLENAVRAGDSELLPPGINASTFNGVVPIAKIWSGQSFPLKVCFFGGYTKLRQRIASAASAWESPSNGILLDFGDKSSPRSCTTDDVNHIRISFSYRGYWSTVGSDSVNRAYQNQSSMNYGGWNTWALPPNDEVLSSTVVHEFGHALGFEHEHQHPLSKCEEQFDWEKIYDELSQSPNRWDKDKVDHNMRKLAERGRLFPNEIDLDSIMLYQFPASFYKLGSASECYQPRKNIEISDNDFRLAARIYPPTELGMIQAQQARRKQVLEILGTEFQDPYEFARVLNKYDTASGIPHFGPYSASAIREFENYGLNSRIRAAVPGNERLNQDLPSVAFSQPPSSLLERGENPQF